MANFTARKILKQGYPATYNFIADTDGAAPTGWTSNNDSGCTTTVIATLDGHRKVLQLYDNSAVGKYDIEIDFSAAYTSGKIDLWFHTTDNTLDHILQLLDTSNTVCIQVDLNGIAGVGDDTWYHYSINFDCTPDTYDHYLDGVSIAAGVAFDAGDDGSGILTIKFIGTDADTGYYNYVDAIDCSRDANYVWGDNIFWKNLMDSMAQANFEGEDLYTTSTSIGFIDTDNNNATCTVKIIPSFDEHKKILEFYDGNGAGRVNSEHDFSAAQASGTMEFYIKCSDVTDNFFLYFYSGATIGIHLGIVGSYFWYYDTAGHNIVAAANDTWYHIKIEFECGAEAYKGLAADTFYIWVNNIRYGAYGFRNAVANLDMIRFYTELADSGQYTYFDAFGCSWETDYEIADNRIFEYHALSYIDITSIIFSCQVTDTAYQISTAIISGASSLSIDTNNIIQLYDSNSALRFEGEESREIKASLVSDFPLVSLNKPALIDESTYTASAAQDTNATLLGVLTNVSQVDGRLIYYTEDDPAGNLTPNYRNKPYNRIIKDLSIHSNVYGIIQPNGKVCLDADRNPTAGAATISESTGEIMSNPFMDAIDFQYNYVEVRGGIDPDTGTPFSGVSQDTTAQTLSGIKKWYKRYRELQSDADCLARAVALRTNAGITPTIINVAFKSIFGNPGEIINFAYAPKSLTAANYYIEAVHHNLVTGVSSYRLNSGIIDRATMNEPGYTLADETADDIAEVLYSTDKITVYPSLFEGNGATRTALGIELDAVGDDFSTFFFVGDKIDDSREIVVEFIWSRRDANNDTVDYLLTASAFEMDGTSHTIEFNLAIELAACAQTRHERYTYTIASGDVYADCNYYFKLDQNEAGDTLAFNNVKVSYFIKRTVS